jgi:hypothetical protein
LKYKRRRLSLHNYSGLTKRTKENPNTTKRYRQRIIESQKNKENKRKADDFMPCHPNMAKKVTEQGKIKIV